MVGNGCELGHLKRDRKDISVERSRMLESKKRLFYVLLIGLSVTLHIATISMMTYLGSELARNKRVLDEVTRITSKNFRYLFRFRNDTVGITGPMNRHLQEVRHKVEENSERMRNFDQNMIQDVIDKSWRVGCPLEGIGNGNRCFAIERDKLNYTQAVDSCKRKGGELAAPDDSELLRRLNKKFPKDLYLIDAKYNKENGRWETSKGDVAEFLPESVVRKQRGGKNGSCVYIDRRGFNRWHCEAKMFYLCSYA